MRKLFLLVLVALAANACKRQCDCTLQANRLILIKVDFQTYQFEGAFEQVLGSNFATFDSLPITSTFVPPGDFGNLKLNYLPNKELIFDGDIVWNGWGPINFPPVFEPAVTFNRTGVAQPMPDTTRFQNLFSQVPAFKKPLDSVWMDISDLKIVEEYLASPKNIGYFLYTPSVGFGNPADWDWFIVMNAQF